MNNDPEFTAHVADTPLRYVKTALLVGGPRCGIDLDVPVGTNFRDVMDGDHWHRYEAQNLRPDNTQVFLHNPNETRPKANL